MRRAPLLAAILCLLGLAAAPTAQAGVVELGATAERPRVSCPGDCHVVGRLTGYQVRQTGVSGSPYRVPRAGKVVAFNVRIGQPNRQQMRRLARIYGTRLARVSISILRPGRGGRHTLVDQSGTFRLNRYFGSAPTFALPRPLRAAAGDVVAITVPTWAPIFSVGLGEGEAWRSSRPAGKCDDLTANVALQRLRSSRIFGCLYRTARLRYTASFVPTPAPTAR